MEILKFSATWCAPCKQVAAVMESMNIDIPIKNIDIDSEQDIVAEYNIRSVPTLIFLDEDVEIGRLIGQKNRDQIQDWIDTCEEVVHAVE